MEDLLNCLQDWLAKNRADNVAYALLCALTEETKKVAKTSDGSQREFTAADLAPAAGGPAAKDFDAAKGYVTRARLEVFVEARRTAIEAHFRAAGHGQALVVRRRSPGGKHRAVWYLEAYDLPEPPTTPELTDPVEPPRPAVADAASPTIRYDFIPPGQVKAAWYGKPLVGAGSFVTRSWRGLLWIGLLLVPVTFLVLSLLMGLGFAYVKQPVQTSDLASMVLMAGTAWVAWWFWLRPFTWLLDDRITLASEAWVAGSEPAAQLELALDANKRRRLQLVRYTAVCPICAGTIELRYAQGVNRRRLVGCCSEVPHEHVFSFDRVLRTGQRIEPS